MQNSNLFIRGIDWWTILIYLALVLLGWISIYAAVFNEDHANMFDMSQRYGSQIMWIGICCCLAIVILLIDVKYYYFFAYPIYGLMILVLLSVFVLGSESHGAKSWIQIGSFSIQPAEFGKFAVALVLAKYMSSYSFDIHNLRSLLGISILIGLPFLLVLFQNDTGSALVYSSFLFMLYREGLNKWVYVILFQVVLLFIASFLIEPVALIMLILMITLLAEGMTNGLWRSKFIYLSVLLIIMILLKLLSLLWSDGPLDGDVVVLISIGLTFPFIILYGYRYQLRNVVLFVVMFVSSIGYTLSVDYVFEHILQEHQQKRILDVLGLEEDLKHWGYNVNQSKIAIGSGGFSGKGFLQGTQTKYDFVPEQSTDFIYCTIGEEFGFLGSALVVFLFSALIFRLMRMGDRQRETFGRVYCYGAASIFFFHVVVNIGMTLGIFPVIGIPLPFFSYGGSSLVAFTILLFVALRLNLNNEERGCL